MKTIKLFFGGLLLTSLSGCGLFDSDEDEIVDDYTVGWIDVRSSRALRKFEGLVPAYVFAVGHDKKYIYAKQHPLNSQYQIDQSITNYFIIERTKEQFQDKPQYGPLTKEQFDNMCAQLGIKDPIFDMTYTENP